MVFNEAPGQHKPLPPGFPTCEDFALTDQQSEDYDLGGGPGGEQTHSTTGVPSTPSPGRDCPDTEPGGI